MTENSRAGTSDDYDSEGLRKRSKETAQARAVRYTRAAKAVVAKIKSGHRE